MSGFLARTGTLFRVEGLHPGFRFLPQAPGSSQIVQFFAAVSRRATFVVDATVEPDSGGAENLRLRTLFRRQQHQCLQWSEPVPQCAKQRTGGKSLVRDVGM